MSYKANFICMRILIVNHTQSYGIYLTYEYIFFTIIISWYLFNKGNIHPLKTIKNDNEYHNLSTISNRVLLRHCHNI